MLSDLKEAAKQGLKGAFSRSSPGVQEAVLSANTWVRSFRKYGREFRRCRALVERTQWQSEEALRELQAERLRALVCHAYANVPYYRSLFDRHGIRPGDIRDPADLPRIPLLTRNDVRRHFDRLISRRHWRVRGHLVGTSGTTGAPLHVLLDRRREAMETALVQRHLSWAGVRPGEPRAALRGLEIDPGRDRHTRHWRLDRAENMLHFSSSHLSEATFPSYLARLRAFRPAIVWGYPSSVHVLASFMRARNETLGVPLKAVMLSSEPVYDWQRQTIEAAFESRVYDWYGLSEGVLSAGECEVQDGYHVNVESGILECLPSSDLPGVTEVVATGLDNFLMPLIRYQTGDSGRWLGRRCPCGRGLPLMAQVQTKMDDVVVTPDGRWISPSVLTFPFKPVSGIAKSQIVQRSTEELLIRIVVDEGYSARQEERLVTDMKVRLGSGMQIRVEHVDDIPRTASGKYRWVVSELRR